MINSSKKTNCQFIIFDLLDGLCFPKLAPQSSTEPKMVHHADLRPRQGFQTYRETEQPSPAYAVRFNRRIDARVLNLGFPRVFAALFGFDGAINLISISKWSCFRLFPARIP